MNQLKKDAFVRFLRTIIPQLPATFAYLAQQAQLLSVPEWVVPTLVLLGGIATALDKYIRSLEALVPEQPTNTIATTNP